MIIELSTIFVNNRVLMKELGIDESPEKWRYRFKINGYMLIITFFLARVVFLGVILAAYVLPTLINYKYDQAIKDLGWFKVRWAQTLMILFLMLYFLNLYWFYKLIKMARRFSE